MAGGVCGIHWTARSVAALLVGLLFAVAVLSRRSCDTRASLTPMLLAVDSAFARNNITWALEGGTLLGAIREGDLLAHEFDNDVTVLDAPALVVQMEQARVDLLRDGYYLYRDGDYCLAKGLLNLYMGSFDPYITTVDYRVYDYWMVRPVTSFLLSCWTWRGLAQPRPVVFDLGDLVVLHGRLRRPCLLGGHAQGPCRAVRHPDGFQGARLGLFLQPQSRQGGLPPRVDHVAVHGRLALWPPDPRAT